MACLTEAPPPLPGARALILRPGEEFCPAEATGGCYMAEATFAIAEQLRYARHAWIKCRAKDEEITP